MLPIPPVRRNPYLPWLLVAAALAPFGAQAARPRAELIIMGPGDHHFMRYGHAALRVIDRQGRDRVFNFGITNWDRPNYIIDFLTGRVMFWGDERPWWRVVRRYQKWDRQLERFPLNLTDEQVDRLLAKLYHDTLIEYREYRYDTFRNNCATRLRDYLDDVTDGAVRRSLKGVEPDGPSYHDDVRDAFASLPTLLLLTEIIPGLPFETPRSLWERAYLPAGLLQAMRRVTLERDGETIPLLQPRIVAYERKKPYPLVGWRPRARFLLAFEAAMLVLLGILLAGAGRRVRGAFAAGWVLFASLLGVVLEVVGYGTDWPDMRESWLALGFISIDIWLLGPALRLLFGRRPYRPGRWVHRYLLARLVIILLLAGLAPFPWFRGPASPRLWAAAGLYMLLRCFAWPPRSPPPPAKLS